MSRLSSSCRIDATENQEAVQRCKSARGLCKGAKVEAGKITECRVRSTVSCDDRAKVQIGRRPVQKWKGGGGGTDTKGRGVASPRPSWLGGQDGALPLPASGARERDGRQGKRLSERGQAPSRERDEARPQQARLGWHAVPTLPETRGRLGQHVGRSLPQDSRTWG